jgi:hypothetical protein
MNIIYSVFIRHLQAGQIVSDVWKQNKGCAFVGNKIIKTTVELFM